MTISSENKPTQTPDNQEVKNDKEYNFAQIRKQLEQERQARLLAEARAKELDAKIAEKFKEEEDDDDLYVDKKNLVKHLQTFEQKMEKIIEEKAAQKARSLLEEEKKELYLKENKDFHEVMTEENLEKFATEHPALAKSLIQMPDSFERQKLVYENIKALGIKKEKERQSIQATVDSRARGPYYQPTNVGSAPYTPLGDFSPAGQKSAYAKMQELKNRLRI